MPAKKPLRRKSKIQSFNFKQVINTTPEEASRMFTHETGLRDWFCDWASINATKEGVVQMRWNSGHYMSGQFFTCEPGKKLVFTWDGRGEPAPTRVAVTFKPKGEATVVTVSHSGVGSGPEWARTANGVQNGWRGGLENLKSVIETGIDLRIARRPRLGIGIDEFNPEIAAKIGVPVKAGIRISGTAEGTGARAAGLIKDDVLVKFNGKTITSSLDAALQGLKAGDEVPIQWYRGKEKMKGSLRLGTFPISSVPESAAELAEAMRKLYADLGAEWATAVGSLTEAEAEHKEGSEWSVKELIAHFIALERDYQSWLASMLRGNAVYDDLEFRPNMDERMRPIVKRYETVSGLLAELRAAQAETVEFIASLPDRFVARKHLYRRAALWGLENMPSHFREEHGEQIRAAIGAAKK